MENPTEWVDFKAIKAAVSIEMVLDHYGVTGLKKSEKELRGKCPIHRGTNNKHFTANLTKNVFKCFFAQCGAHGNVLDFVATMDHCSVRDAAMKLKEWFNIGDTERKAENEPVQMENAPKLKRGIYSDKVGALYEVVTSAFSARDLETLVVYRELFGKYRFWVAPSDAFLSPDESA